MKSENIKLSKKTAQGFVHDFGPVSLVFASTDIGTVACGIFDAATFDKFNFPAVRVKGESPITSIEDLLRAKAVIINESAKKLGIADGMNGKEALELM